MQISLPNYLLMPMFLKIIYIFQNIHIPYLEFLSLFFFFFLVF